MLHLNIIFDTLSQMEEAELLVDAASRLSEPFLLVIVVILCLHYILVMTSSICVRIWLLLCIFHKAGINIFFHQGILIFCVVF